MADQNPTGADRESPDPRSTAREDAIVEAAVLGFVLQEHPDHLTVSELLLAIEPRTDGFADEDALQRAITRLIGAGLLHLAGGLVVPSRAALCFSRLEVG
jgi:hypothetical protein